VGNKRDLKSGILALLVELVGEIAKHGGGDDRERVGHGEPLRILSN
jgi:hypothetical protein